jgi:hypothetical protein
MVVIEPSRNCAWHECGNPLLPAAMGRPNRYCKRACRQRAYEERRALRGLLEQLLPGDEPTFVTDETAAEQEP